MSGTEKKKTPAVMLICGDDEFRVAESARAAVNRFCPPSEQALSLEIVEGNVATQDEAALAARGCLMGLQTVGFFAAAKTVWLRDATFFGDLDLLKSDVVKPRLDELLEECKQGLMPGVHFVISSSKVDARSAFYKALQAVSDVQRCDLPEKQRELDEQSREFAESQFEKAGLVARRDAVDALLARCGGSREIVAEVEKVALYAMPRKNITVEDVHAIVSSSRETMGWDLADNFGYRDLRAALRTLRQLLFQKESPHGMIAGIESRIRDLIIFKDCLDRGWARLTGSGDWRKVEWPASPDADAVLAACDKDPRKMNPWRAGKMAVQADGFTPDELRRCHRDCVSAHERMVSSPVPAEMLLEILLVRIVGRVGHAAVA